MKAYTENIHNNMQSKAQILYKLHYFIGDTLTSRSLLNLTTALWVNLNF